MKDDQNWKSKFFKKHTSISPRKIIKLIFILTLLGLVLFSPLAEFISLSNFTDAIESARSLPSAPIIFVSLYILGIVFALPGIAFMFLGGSIFGFWKGLMLVIIASNIGCQFTFFISRILGRDFVGKFFKMNKFLVKLSDKIETNGFMVMLYLRLIPLFPFSMINYASGLTNIKHRDYALGTFLGKIPAMVIYLYISSNFTDFENNKNKIPIYIIIFALFTAVTLILEKRQKIFK